MENHNLIDRYFENSLSPKEQKQFNNLLQNDLKFKAEFQFQKDLKQVIEVNQKEGLRETVSKIEALAQKDSRMMMLPKKWIVAASLLLITGLATWTVKSTYFPSNDAIYEEYFQLERNTVQPVVRGESINTIEYKAFAAYEARDFYKAINLFNSVQNPEDSNILFYKGLCFLAVNKPENAIALFNQLTASELNTVQTEGLSDKANWYLALAYLKNNETDKTIEQLTTIVNRPPPGYKKNEAEKILNYLK